MKTSMWFMGALATTLVASWAGCGGGGGSGAATTTSPTSTGGSTGSSSSSSGTSTADAGPTGPFECTVPSTAPSLGSCVTTVAANDAGTGVECNPVTQSGCTGTYNACDYNVDDTGNLIGFTCFPNMMYTVPACGSCDPTYNKGPFCKPGFTCLVLDQAAQTGTCVRYCCTDGDCGSGKCAVTLRDAGVWSPVSNTLGVCTTM
jgi:hypothetical protein